MYRALPTPVAIFHFLLWEETDGVSLLLKAHTIVFLGPVNALSMVQRLTLISLFEYFLTPFRTAHTVLLLQIMIQNFFHLVLPVTTYSKH